MRTLPFTVCILRQYSNQNSIRRVQILKYSICRSWKLNSKRLCDLNFTNGIATPKRGVVRPPASSFEKDNKFKLKDKVPVNYNLIYKIPRPNKWKLLSLVFDISFLSSIALSVYWILVKFEILEEQLVKHKPPSLLREVIRFDRPSRVEIPLGMIMFINTGSMLFLRRVPIRIYQSSSATKDYIAIYMKYFLPWLTSKRSFKTTVKYNPYFSFWGNIYFKLDGKKTIMFLEYFKTPAHMFSMIGKSHLVF